MAAMMGRAMKHQVDISYDLIIVSPLLSPILSWMFPPGLVPLAFKNILFSKLKAVGALGKEVSEDPKGTSINPFDGALAEAPTTSNSVPQIVEETP